MGENYETVERVDQLFHLQKATGLIEWQCPPCDGKVFFSLPALPRRRKSNGNAKKRVQAMVKASTHPKFLARQRAQERMNAIKSVSKKRKAKTVSIASRPM